MIFNVNGTHNPQVLHPRILGTQNHEITSIVDVNKVYSGSCINYDISHFHISYKTGGGAEMRATHGHDITTLNMSMRLEAARSVGIIRGPSSYGTGFLVGDLQIMAPAHVIKDISKYRNSVNVLG